MGEYTKECMRRFREEKLEISDYPNSIVIETVKHDLLKNYDLFKMVP